jgi:hypothetical protein
MKKLKKIKVHPMGDGFSLDMVVEAAKNFKYGKAKELGFIKPMMIIDTAWLKEKTLKGKLIIEGVLVYLLNQRLPSGSYGSIIYGDELSSEMINVAKLIEQELLET